MTETDGDRYPQLSEVLSRLTEDTSLLNLNVRRVEINLHQTGDANYRVWRVGEDEPDVGYYAEAELTG